MTAFSSLAFGALSVAAATMPAPIPPAADMAAGAPVYLAQTTIRQSVIVRVPVRPDTPPVKWVEKSSRKCVDIDSIAGASVVSPEALDLFIRGGERWRLKFKHECPAISFYRGFYLRPGQDRQICAKRDVIQPRSGGECEIQSIKTLKAEIDD